MLRLHVRDLRGGPASTAGTIDPGDEAFAGLGLVIAEPVRIDGVLQSTDAGNYLWRGHIHAKLAGECRRCLGDVTVAIDDDVDVLFSADPDLVDEPSVYPLAPQADVIDVTPVVREEIALSASPFPLCRTDCKGLCARCGADLNAGPCRCAAAGSTN
ncbi:MAG: YceD family protein [Gemmatimonadales bacterium]